MSKSRFLMIIGVLLLSLAMVGIGLAADNNQSPNPNAVTACVPFSEEFETWPPAGWTVVNYGGTCVWESTSTTFRTNYTGGAGFAADADSDVCGIGTTMNTGLLSPVFSLDGTADPSVFYRLDYNDITSGGGDVGTVDITLDGGATWTNLVTYSTDVVGPADNTIDLSPYAGQPSVQLRFGYFNAGWDWWFEVDDVELSCGTQSPPDIDIQPTSLSASQPTDTVTQQTLSVCNLGAGDLFWDLEEVPLAIEGSMPFVPVASGPSTGVAAGLTVSSPIVEIVAPEAPSNPDAVLWDQPLSAVNINAYVNQDFTDLPSYSSFLADDFQNAEPWTIDTIFVPGDGWNGFSSLMNASALTWQIYEDAGGVPAGDPTGGGDPPVWTLSLSPADAQVTITPGTSGYPSNTTLNLTTPIDLPSGDYWLIFYPSLPFSGGGQFGRQASDTVNADGGQFINPGGSFGFGTAWQSWTILGVTEHDIAFRLEGTTGPVVGIPWLDEDPTAGQLAPGFCQDVTVSFDSTGLAEGQYFGELAFNSNDPVDPVVVVPVDLTVTGGAAQAILLVDDDDNSPDVRSYYTDALDALGLTYEIWDTANSDNEPDATFLATFDTVIWFSGDEFGGFAGPGADGEAALAEWLGGGGGGGDTIVGDWSLNFDWTCSGFWNNVTWSFFPDGTFMNAYGETGTWTQTGTDVLWVFDDPSRSDYWYGVIAGDSMEGNMYDPPSGMTGCWNASRLVLGQAPVSVDGSTAPAEKTPLFANSYTMPEGYVPKLTVSQNKGTNAGLVGLFKDDNPWGSLAWEYVMDGSGISYEVHTSAEFASLDFNNFAMIIVACSQSDTFYANYAANMTKFEDFVEAGGFLNFCAATQGATLTLPGGMVSTFYGEAYNWIDDLAHPLVAGIPNPFNGSWASHNVFSSLPADAHLIAHGQDTGAPTLVEYPMGAGWFVGYGQTLEISWDLGWEGGPIVNNAVAYGDAWSGGGGGAHAPCLLLSSQDYLFDRGLTPFGEDYLGISNYTSDAGAATVTGEGTVFSGLGPYTMAYPGTDYADVLVSDATAEYAFFSNNGETALDKYGATYFTTFLSYMLEGVPDVADRAAVVSAFLNGCGGGVVPGDPDIAVTPLSLSHTQPPDVVESEPLTIANEGTGLLTWNIEEDEAFNYVPNAQNDAVTPLNSSNSLSTDASFSAFAPAKVMQKTNANLLALINDGSFENGPPPGSAWTEVSDQPCEWIGDWTGVWGVPAFDGIYDYWAGGYCGGVPTTSHVSQAIPVPAVGATLSFWYISYRPDPDDGGDYAYISVDGTTVWSMDLIQANDTYPNFVNATVDLTAYAGQTVTLEFGGVSSGASTGNIRFDFIEWAVPLACDSPVDVPWLSAVPNVGETAPGEFSLVDVFFDSAGLPAGTYNANLCVFSNDPDEGLIQVPVTLEVVGAPVIVVAPPSLEATLFTNEQQTQALEVCNEGDSTLNWSLAEIEYPKGTMDVLYDNGPLVTHPGGGFGGADASALQTALGLTIYGFGAQYSAGNRMADDFTIADPSGWTIDQISFFAYQTGSPTTPSPITAVYYQIWDGPPDDPASTVVFGDLSTNRLLTTNWSNMYRVLDTGLLDTARPPMLNVASAGVTLPPGTYWLDWNFDGNAAFSGPWAPPISILGQTTTGNAMQWTGAWAPAVDGASQQGMPFIIEGTMIPSFDLEWLSENPTSGSVEPGLCETVDVTFDSTGLALGTYTGALDITSNDPATPSVVVPVTLNVVASEPDILVNPLAFEMTLYANTTGEQIVTIANEGLADLIWNLGTDPAWLSAFPTSGTVLPGELTEVTATLSAYGLAAGTYYGTITISSNDPDTPVVEVAVTLNVLNRTFYLPLIYNR